MGTLALVSYAARDARDWVRLYLQMQLKSRRQSWPRKTAAFSETSGV